MKPEIKRAITIIVALAGFVASIAGILLAPDWLRIPSLVVLFVAIVWLFLVWWLRKPQQMPPINGLQAITARYSVDPATIEEIDWIAQLESKVYSSGDAVPKHLLREWYMSNPNGFSIIRMNGQKIGHIDILPLRSLTLGKFLDGTIVELGIRGDSLYAPEQKALIRNLYIESIIIDPVVPTVAIVHLLCSFTSLITRICIGENLENVYAIAATKDGEGLMKKLGFDQLGNAKDRLDHHNLYVAKFKELKGAIANLCKKRRLL